MTISVLCEFHCPDNEICSVPAIAGYLASVLLVELIMFYIGYGFAYKFLNCKKRLLYVGIIIVVYLGLWMSSVITRIGVVPLTTTQILTSIVSNMIEHFAWCAGGIVTRHFFDSNALFVKK
jgi:hypothetical protein